MCSTGMLHTKRIKHKIRIQDNMDVGTSVEQGRGSGGLRGDGSPPTSEEHEVVPPNNLEGTE